MPKSHARSRVITTKQSQKLGNADHFAKTPCTNTVVELSSDNSTMIDPLDTCDSSDSDDSDEDEAELDFSDEEQPDTRSLATRTQADMIASFDEETEDDNIQWAASPIVRQLIATACNWFASNHDCSITPEDAISTKNEELGVKEWFERPRNLNFNLYLLAYPGAAARVLLLCDRYLGVERVLNQRSQSSTTFTLDEGYEVLFPYITADSTMTRWKEELENLERDFTHREPNQMANKLYFLDLTNAVNAFRSLSPAELCSWDDEDAEGDILNQCINLKNLISALQHTSKMLQTALSVLRKALATGEQQPVPSKPLPNLMSPVTQDGRIERALEDIAETLRLVEQPVSCMLDRRTFATTYQPLTTMTREFSDRRAQQQSLSVVDYFRKGVRWIFIGLVFLWVMAW